MPNLWIFPLTMPINLCLFSFFLLRLRTWSVGCSHDGEQTKSGSSGNIQVPFSPCYKSHSYGVTHSEWCISTYPHTTTISFSSGVTFHVIWGWKSFPLSDRDRSQADHCPPWPTYSITSQWSSQSFNPFPLASLPTHLSPLSGFLLIYILWSLHLISLSAPFIPFSPAPCPYI